MMVFLLIFADFTVFINFNHDFPSWSSLDFQQLLLWFHLKHQTLIVSVLSQTCTIQMVEILNYIWFWDWCCPNMKSMNSQSSNFQLELDGEMLNENSKFHKWCTSFWSTLSCNLYMRLELGYMSKFVTVALGMSRSEFSAKIVNGSSQS